MLLKLLLGLQQLFCHLSISELRLTPIYVKDAQLQKSLLVFEHFFACSHLNMTAIMVPMHEMWLQTGLGLHLTANIKQLSSFTF